MAFLLQNALRERPALRRPAQFPALPLGRGRALGRSSKARNSGRGERRGQLLGDAELGAVEQGDWRPERDVGRVSWGTEGRNGPSARRGRGGSAHRGVSELRALGG